MKRFQKAIVCLLALAMLLSVSLTGVAAQEKVTLRMSWWGGDARHEAILAIINAFMAENPNIVIEPEYSAFAQYRDKFNIQITSGASADILAVDQPWVAGLVSQGDYFVDLNAYADVLDLASYDAFLMDSYARFDGRTLLLPIGINGMGSLVDRGALAAYGFTGDQTVFTWNDLIELGKAVHAADPANYLCCVDSKQAALYYARVYLRQLTGRQLINDDGTMGCTKEELAEALGLVDTLYKEAIFQPIAESAVYNNTMTQNPAWINRQMFMILGRTSAMTDGSARLKKEDGTMTTTGFVMPTLENGVETGIEVRPAVMYAISKDSKHPAEAAQFLAYMFNNEAAIRLLKANYSVPSREASRAIASAEGLLDVDALANAEYSLANAGSMLNSWSSNTEVEALFTEIMEKIAYGQYKDMMEAADEVFERIADIVDANS